MIDCIKCKKGLADKSTNYFCSVCGYLNIFYEVNYFDYLGLPISLNVNLDNLEDKYLELMLKYHPDKFINKDDIEQRNALSHSSFLNNAYITLKNPLLILSHIYKNSFDRDIIKDEMTINNPLIAMEFLELYEQLDGIDNKADLEEFMNQMKINQLKILQDLDEIDLLNITQDNSEKLVMGYIKLKYVARVLEKSLFKNIR